MRYSENLFSTGITIILALVTAAMGLMAIVQLIVGPLGSKPAPDWMLWGMTGLFLLITINFSVLRLRVDTEGFRVSYGVFSLRIPRSAIVSAELDQKGAFYGWGIRIGRYDGDWCWVYNVIGGPREAIKRSEGKFKRVLVSTARPEELQKALVG